MKKLVLLCSSAAILVPTTAFAQSSGTQDFEKKEEAIIVTGTRNQQVGGVVAPDTPKAKAVLTQEYIARQNPGQTVLDTINAVPGVSFQNNDAYGSSGGTLNIRGFDSSRISLTFDGIPLNDSGNYAIFSNQQVDPELIDQVNVNLGSTDVDSPTASAVGGTVNLRTRLPHKEMGGRVVGSLGQFDFRRIFAVFDTGEIGPWGTRAFIAASTAKNDNPFNNYGKVDKQQYNAKIYQPLGSNGDYISLSGHYNQNRNNFFGSLPLRQDKTRVVGSAFNNVDPSNPAFNIAAGTVLPRIVGPNGNNRYPTSRDEREYDINYTCQTAAARPGVVDAPALSTAPNGEPDVNQDYASCGTEFDRRYNPSNTGNLKLQSRFTLTDALTLNIDPSFQYVKANGGGTTTAREGLRDINPLQPPDPDGAGPLPRPPAIATTTSCALGDNAFQTCVPGYFGGNPFAGRDLNGDGDLLDTVTVLAPSQTRTYRFGVIAGMRYVINDDHQVRVGYTLDHANHRQTGEVGLLDRSGEPFDVFPVNDPLAASNGSTLQKRDRKSLAILNQLSAEYRGEFFEDRLTVNIGLAQKWFTRKLDQRCFTSSAGGFVECSGGNAALDAIIAANNPYAFNPTTGAVTGFAPPGKRTLKYNKLTPNIGFVFDVTPRISTFANYSTGLSVPSTDNLYNAFYYPEGTEQAKPEPETTANMDAGLRYRSSKVQAQISVWKTNFKNRSASAYDPELNATVFRNLGRVDKWGIDGNVAWSPMSAMTLYAFGSWNDSKIKENIQIGRFGTTGFATVTDCDNIPSNALPSDVVRSCAFTAGNRESGAPKYTYGFSVLGKIGPVDLGVTAKRTGPRYIFDNNQPVYNTGVNLTNLNDASAANDPAQVFGATAPAYWLVNLDARFNMKFVGLKETYFQLNVYNLFDKFYVGGFGGGLAQSFNTGSTQFGNPPFVQIGAPRTVSGTLSIEF